MNNDALPLDASDMRLVAEIGFIGVQAGQAVAARALFEALQVLRPDSNLPYIGRALAELSIERPQDAVRILRDEGLKQHPGDLELMAFLGVALQDAGQSAESNRISSAVVAQQGDSDEPHFKMASKLLSLRVFDNQAKGFVAHWGEKPQGPGPIEPWTMDRISVQRH